MRSPNLLSIRLLSICLGLTAQLGLGGLQGAHASRVYYKYISLDQVVSTSSAIVIARPAKPHRIAVKFQPEGEAKIAPYTRMDTYWVIDEILAQKDGAPLKVGQPIQVAPGAWSGKYRLHLRHQRDGTRKSPIYPRYSPEVPLVEGQPAILFLQVGEYEGRAFWELTVDAALAPLTSKTKVQQLISGVAQTAAPAQGSPQAAPAQPKP